MFTTEYTGISTAPPDAVWSVLADVAGWVEWNDGVSAIELVDATAPVGVGTEYRMTDPGQGTLTSRIVEFDPGSRLTDLTLVDDIAVTVVHLVEPDDDGGTRITYRVQVDGPVPDDVLRQIGESASEDFPDVIAALAAAATR